MDEVGRISDIVSGIVGACTVTLVEGHALSVVSSVPFALASVVKAEVGNRMWMGEVCACQAEQDGFAVEIQIESFLKDVASVEALAARFRHERSINSKLGSTEDPVVSTRRDIS